jgi:WhiB family redox-sensing transcriptional regulator
MSNVHELADVIEGSADYSWVADAACRELDITDIDRFFVEAGHSLSKQTASMCAACPVRTQCLDHACRNEIAGGYFGGVSPTQRRKIAREPQG